ncbi:MAG TPA: class I SAM-dependent methyltransferase [Caulobacteraceae bacterium]|nr:class I SAM-dependent methyltransferase [Caulobacteraceae bacterium]
MGEAVLVFPAGMPDGLAFRDRAKAMGLTVIGASSLEHDPAEGAYDGWEHLPYVSDPDFDRALAEVVRRHAVSAVHTPHYVVFKHLSERLGRIAPGARLTAGQSQLDNEKAYADLHARVAEHRQPAFWSAFAPKPALTTLERAGLVRLVSAVPGMCGEEKMHAIMETMRHAPAGDIVEIGSWCGRSASLFVLLSHRYELGKVLCVDPWAAEALPQGDDLLDRASADCDCDAALSMFETNLSPIALGRLNYVRARAADFAPAYGPGLTITTDAFGTTAYAGRIAVLHIDGNHALEEAERDTALWTPHVVPGGWVIFDDYEWAFGDGPRQVADAFVARHAGRIAARFQAGAALFVQLGLTS